MLRVFLLVLLSALLLGCQPKTEPFVATDITGAEFASALQLTAHDGSKKQLADFKGKLVVVFFGYTHCPDICPTTLSDLAKTMRLLGDKSQSVQVLFVTLDPQRDSVEVLKKFVPSFYPSFIGLTGSQAEIDAVAKNFKVYLQKQPANDAEQYTIDHSAGAYVYDQQGQLKLYFKYGQTPKDMAHDLMLLLK